MQSGPYTVPIVREAIRETTMKRVQDQEGQETMRMLTIKNPEGVMLAEMDPVYVERALSELRAAAMARHDAIELSALEQVERLYHTLREGEAVAA